MKNAIAFGDSILKGVTVRNGRYQLAPDRFTDILSKELSCGIENKGRMGSTVRDLDKMIGRSATELQDPAIDTVFLEYGGNDCDFDWQAVSDRPDEAHFCQTDMDAYSGRYREGIAGLQAMGKQVYLLSLPPIDPEKYFSRISRDKNGEAILHWLRGDKMHLMHWHEMYNLEVFRIGAAAGARVLDISSCFLSRPNYTRLLCEDGIHVNPDGHRVIAESILRQLRTDRLY